MRLEPGRMPRLLACQHDGCRASPGMGHSEAVALADLDADGDLDALVGNQGPDEVWWIEQKYCCVNLGFRRDLSSKATDTGTEV